MAQIISGKTLAAEVKQRVAQGVAALRAAGHPVCLRVFLVGDDAASATYVAGKERDCAECGITSQVVRLPADTPQAQLVAEVQAASADSAVSGWRMTPLCTAFWCSCRCPRTSARRR